MFRSFAQRLQNSRRFAAVVALASVLATGAADYVTGADISLSLFYLVSITLAVWYVGRWFGVALSILSVVISMASDWALGALTFTHFAEAWNAASRAIFYLVVVWLLSSLKSQHERLEERVRRRTIALSEEIAERERLEKEILGISEREQRRIGHDLHDSLCQHLTATAIAGAVIEERLSAKALPEAAGANRVVEMVEEGITLARNLARGLSPVHIEAEGLMDGLQELADQNAERFKVECVFECDPPVLIEDGAVATHLYRIAQEAISNAIQHGKANEITISLTGSDRETTLSIADDGVGLPETLPARRGMGLRIMNHRASMIGGTLSVERAPAGGTVVTCSSSRPASRRINAEYVPQHA
jgi:signal transduction histidine kinase